MEKKKTLKRLLIALICLICVAALVAGGGVRVDLYPASGRGLP